MTTTDKLNAIEARANAATEGPWAYVARADGRAWIDMPGIDGHALGLHGFGHDAEFIAAARTDVPALVAALRDVLAMHHQDDHGPGRCDMANCITSCIECGDDWPCATVRAITSALDGAS